MSLPRTLGDLRRSAFSEERLRTRRVKDELRDNLMTRLREGGDASVFPGIVGYDDSVVPQIVNAIFSRHNFILLGLRGQAKSRILRALTTLLDAQTPYLAGCEIHDSPYAPICRRCRDELARLGDDAPIAYLTPDERYVEKLATPDVTIADLIGDIDPIKAAEKVLETAKIGTDPDALLRFFKQRTLDHYYYADGTSADGPANYVLGDMGLAEMVAPSVIANTTAASPRRAMSHHRVADVHRP